MARAPGFSCRNEIFYLLLSHIAVRNKPKSGVIKPGNIRRNLIVLQVL